ncbi:MAG: hypothetical protein AAF389_21160 [Gemmatimonadota bacterium]
MTRRYTDDEFREILRTALALQEKKSSGTDVDTREGLALTDIEAIAAEVGVDAALVRQAAGQLGSVGATGLGGLSTQRVIQVDGSIPAELGERGLTRLIDAVRAAADAPGTAQHVLGGLEWKRGGEMVQAHVSLSPREGETRVRVSMDRTTGMSASGALAIVGGIFSMLAVIAGAKEGLDLLIPVLGLAPFAVSVGIVAAVWKRSAKAAAREAQKILDAVLREGQDIAKAASGESLPTASPDRVIEAPAEEAG